MPNDPLKGLARKFLSNQKTMTEKEKTDRLLALIALLNCHNDSGRFKSAVEAEIAALFGWIEKDE